MDNDQRSGRTRPGIIRGLGLVIAFAGCLRNSARPPLVAEPPQRPHLPSELELEEEEYGRAAVRREDVASVSSDPHHNEEFKGPMEMAPKQDAPGILADILSFPFRAVGWLVSTVF